MKWSYLRGVLILLVLGRFSEAKQRKKNLEKVLHEVIASLLLDENLDRHPRSNGTLSKLISCNQSANTTIYNYWLLPSNTISTPTSTPTTTKTKSSTEMLNYWLDRMPPFSPAGSSIEKLKDQIRFQALVKKTNLEFISFLNKLIEDKKMELNEEDKEIKDEYAELNRTREALFRAYNRQLPDKRLEDLRRKLSEKEVQYRELMSMHRLRRMTRDLHLDTPWININYPGGVIRESLRRKKSRNEFYESYMDSAPGEVSSVVSNDSYLRIDDSDETVSHKTGSKGTKKYTPKTSTMSLGDILWKSLGKYLPFSGKNHANFNSIPLEVHYRVGKDVAHLTIRVGDSEEATTQQLDGLRNT
ncbi:uncharacterized protein [Halyomorpha halys]|uniref:uncharacterized protein isoform X2 n=1 Tax=Halyomorpha halys TaxID=286706 RepID=UPI0006D50CF9|nr:uncharacterized protein LOC106690405 isoform X2 [Halyomorpha halys]